MLYAVQLRLETPMLGDRIPDHTGIRRFQRGKNGEIHIPAARWKSLFELARSDTCGHYDLSAINMPETIRVSATQLYTRRYNRTKIDRFESVQKGATIKMDILVRNESIPNAPGAPGLNVLLSHIGEWIGISPWGSKFNYGRFHVVHITPILKPVPCSQTSCNERTVSLSTSEM